MSASALLDRHLSASGSNRTVDLRHVGDRPLTVNRVMGMHRQQWATHTRETRGIWRLLALANGIPKMQRCRIIVLPLHADRRSPQDVAACAPEVKAAIDGLIDAGLLPHDGPEHLVAVVFLPPLVCGDNGLHLRIEEQ